jgi:GTPase SAR1 family protein
VVLIGDSKCGKTSLVLSYLGKENRSNRDDNVNLFENYQIPIFIRDYQKTVRMQIWDYPGDEMFDRFRPISYITANFVVICFNFANTDSETSLNNIKERWVPEVVAHCGLNVVKFIIGIDRLKGQAKATKTGSALPNFSYFREVARGLDCKYLECSLSDLRSVERVFDKLATLKLKQEHEGLFKDYKEKGQHAGNKLNTMGNTLYFNYLTADNGPTSESSKVTGAIGYRKTSYRRKRHACLIM